MNGLFKNLSLKVLVVLILVVFSLPIEAAEKNKRVSGTVGKNHKITVTPIDSNNNGCGNRMGGFHARYRGKTIGITFTHGKIQSNLEICPTPGQKLSILNRPVDVVGNWSGKDNAGVDQFDAKEIFLSGKNRKVTPSVHRDIAYILSAKITNNEHEMRVFLNNKEVVFKDNTPQDNCNRGQFVFKEYEASSVREIKLGNKIVTQGLDEKGIEQRANPPFEFAQNGSKTEVIAMNAGRAVLLLMYHGSKTSNYCCIKYFIPFVITP